MHLGDGGGRQRLGLELREHRGRRPAVDARDFRQRLLRREWRHLVLELGEFRADVRRQQVLAGGDGLAELHVDRPELLQRFADAHAAGLLAIAAEPVKRPEVEQESERPEQVGLDDQLVEAVAEQHALDDEEAEDEAEFWHELRGQFTQLAKICPLGKAAFN